MSERGEADDEADAQQQIASDLGAALGLVRAPEISLQRRVVEPAGAESRA